SALPPAPPRPVAPVGAGQPGRPAPTPRRAGSGDPAPPHLRALVAGAIAERVARRDAFTAFDITQALRAAHPAENIPHRAGVRESVHAQMTPLIAQGRYVRLTTTYATGEAQRYEPLRAPTAADTTKLP